MNMPKDEDYCIWRNMGNDHKKEVSPPDLPIACIITAQALSKALPHFYFGIYSGLVLTPSPESYSFSGFLFMLLLFGQF